MSTPLLPHQDAPSLSILPSRTVVTSFHPKSHNFEEGDWVLCLATCHALRSISLAVSNGEVQVYDPARLQRVSTYQTRGAQHGASASCVTDLLYHSSSSETSTSPLDGPHTQHNDPPLLWVTNQSGYVQLYDLRQQCQAAGARVPFSSPAWTLSIGHNGTIAAVAGNRKIHFLDVRSLSHHHRQQEHAKQQHPEASPWLGCYRDSHSDHVTCLRFVSESTLLSGGEDGLTALFDTSRPNEPEALQHMWNVGSPVRKAGIMTDAANRASLPPAASTTVWCLTGNETLSLWKPEPNIVRDFPALRQDLNARLSELSSTHPSTLPVMEYLIDAHCDPRNGLLLAAGNAQGDVAVFRLPSANGDTTHDSWTPSHLLAGGHRGVVRGLVHYSESVMMSVGEDARLCEWNRMSASSLPTFEGVRSPAMAAVGGGPARRQRGRPNLGPY